MTQMVVVASGVPSLLCAVGLESRKVPILCVAYTKIKFLFAVETQPSAPGHRCHNTVL